MIFSQSYSHILRHEFTQRVDKNPRYSLRAFAKFLEISPARLSNVLSGKKGLSEGAARSITRILGYGNEETEFFCALVNSQHARNRKTRVEYKKKVMDYVRKHQTFFIQMDAFEAISDVRYFILLQVLKIKKVSAPLTVSLLDSQKNLSVLHQREMIERMVQLGMVVEQEGFYQVPHENHASPDSLNADSLKKFQHDVLECVKKSMDQTLAGERDVFFVALPFEQKKFPEVKEKIRNFVGGLVDEYGQRDHANTVYGISTQFFPLEKV